MNFDAFAQDLPRQLPGWPTAPVPATTFVRQILSDVQSFTSPVIGTLLNTACTYLAHDEIYLEVGAWNGGSVISALYRNQAHARVVDDFSQFSGSHAALSSNLARYDMTGRVAIDVMRDEDFWQGARAGLAQRIGVFFYDGDHSYDATLINLAACLPHLSREALIVVDDLNWPDVDRAVTDFLDARHPGVGLLHRAYTPDRVNQHPVWWNGLALLRVSQKDLR